MKKLTGLLTLTSLTLSLFIGTVNAQTQPPTEPVPTPPTEPVPTPPEEPEDDVRPYTSVFNTQGCVFAPTGTNPFFNLTPGLASTFTGTEEGAQIEKVITVLDETEEIILPDLGTVTARVVEERETTDGKLTEVSRNYYAACDKTNDVYYFGEAVDIFHDDGTITHEGAWRADESGTKFGMIMPGSFLVGSRYFQEQAPAVALDRAENTADGITQVTPVATYEKCVSVEERSSLEPLNRTTKIYCPDVGLVVDGALELSVAPTPAPQPEPTPEPTPVPGPMSFSGL